MFGSIHNQTEAVAACTVDAAPRRDHHHGDGEVCHPASSRSSTSDDEPSRSATTVAGTQASFPSATLTDWLSPTAANRTPTN